MSSSLLIDSFFARHVVHFFEQGHARCRCTLEQTSFTNTEDIRFWMKRPLRDDDMFLMTTTEDEWASRLGLGYDDVLEYTYDVIV